MNKFFTDTEVNALQTTRKNGGIFLKIFEMENRVDVLGTDGRYGYKTIQTFDRNFSSKIKDAYKIQTEYHAPLEEGAYTVSLAWFDAYFCY